MNHNKKMFLYMIMFIINIKWEKLNINIKNRTYYFYNDIIDIKSFDASLLKIGKKSFNSIGIYNIGYIRIKKIDDCKNIHSINPSYLIIANASG